MIEELKQQIEELKQKVAELEAYSGQVTFLNPTSENIIKDFIGRASIAVTGTGSAGTQSVSVPSTPTNINVPAQPSGTLKVSVNGTIYELYYK